MLQRADAWRARVAWLNWEQVGAIALNPWTVAAGAVLGIAMGLNFPEQSLLLAPVGEAYIGLLKMLALPFMVSAVIYSLQGMFRHSGAGALLRRVGIVFLVTILLVATLATGASLLFAPGEGLPPQTVQALGQVIGSGAADTAIHLEPGPGGDAGEAASLSIMQLIPSNIFAALASADTMKVLVFCIFFGFAMGQVPASVSDVLANSLSNIYTACQTLMDWLNYPVAAVLFCICAEQMARSGLGPLKAMLPFLLLFGGLAALCSGLGLVVVWRRSGLTLSQTVGALRVPLTLAVATGESTACMPSMIESLGRRLGFDRPKVELLVPLSVLLLQTGILVYFLSATFFVAQLYGRELTGADILVAVAVSVMASIASAGMSGIVAISLIGLACAQLGLPFEAAAILFITVDPICDALRALTVVTCNSAAITMICNRAAPPEPEAP